MGAGVNVIKLFTVVIYKFSYPRVFVRIGWKSLSGDDHSDVLRKFVNYGQKSFITLAPGVIVIKLFCMFAIS